MNSTIKHLLFARAKTKKNFELSVNGTSMHPILHAGDTITVCARDHYVAGDILVFFYKHDELLVHRLLKIEKARYFCKGDNAFRLEDIEKNSIVGAVVLNADIHNTSEFIAASYAISQLFRNKGFDSDMTKLSPEYIEYKDKYL